MIDNFDMVKDHLLKFDRDGELYMILILRRRKDVKGKVVEGVNEDNRRIKHYFVYNKDYFEKKRQAIINLCEQNNARAYILPQRRTCKLVLWNLHDTISDTLKKGSMNVHFDHLIRSGVAGMHKTPPDAKWHKRWVIDIDEDDSDFKVIYHKWCVQKEIYRAWCVEHDPLEDSKEVFLWSLQRKLQRALCNDSIHNPFSEEAVKFMPDRKHDFSDSDVVILPTPHGFHIVTPPFNREPKAMEEYFGFAIPSAWIKPDAMAMLYAPDSI